MKTKILAISIIVIFFTLLLVFLVRVIQKQEASMKSRFAECETKTTDVKYCYKIIYGINNQ